MVGKLTAAAAAVAIALQSFSFVMRRVPLTKMTSPNPLHVEPVFTDNDVEAPRLGATMHTEEAEDAGKARVAANGAALRRVREVMQCTLEA